MLHHPVVRIGTMAMKRFGHFGWFNPMVVFCAAAAATYGKSICFEFKSLSAHFWADEVHRKSFINYGLDPA